MSLFGKACGIGADPRWIVHVGAHRCQERDEYGHALVDWIEADPATATEAERILESYPRQRIIRALLSDTDNCPTRFYRASNDGASSSIFRFDRHPDFAPQITLGEPIVLFSSTLDSLGLRPDWLTLDVQGAELLVLHGGVRTLSTVEWILTEVATVPLYDGGCQFDDLDWFLEQHGFRRVLTEMSMFDGTHGDAVYCR